MELGSTDTETGDNILFNDNSSTNGSQASAKALEKLPEQQGKTSNTRQ
jgi:hypothetical protein